MVCTISRTLEDWPATAGFTTQPAPASAPISLAAPPRRVCCLPHPCCCPKCAPASGGGHLTGGQQNGGQQGGGQPGRPPSGSGRARGAASRVRAARLGMTVAPSPGKADTSANTEARVFHMLARPALAHRAAGANLRLRGRRGRTVSPHGGHRARPVPGGEGLGRFGRSRDSAFTADREAPAMMVMHLTARAAFPISRCCTWM